MAIFSCPECGKKLKVKTDFAGKKVKCPGCLQGVVVMVQAVTAAAKPVAATASAPEGKTGLPQPRTASFEEETLPPRNEGSVDRATLLPEVSLPPGCKAEGQIETLDASERSSDSDGALPRIAGYEVLSILGRGGMGVVYKARQTGLNRLVALKMILTGAYAGPSARQRFLTEAEAVARLRHPNIVQIHQIGEHDGLPFFSLEYCDGGSLEKQLNGTPLPAAAAAQIVGTLAEAMQAAHEADIIHRDLKPANVLLQRPDFRLPMGQEAPVGKSSMANPQSAIPKITDFGLAKKLDDVGQTASGAVMGTPSYMAPEQAAGAIQQQGPAADIYALGAILYDCLTGRPPFKAATPLETIMQVVSTEPVSPSQLNSRVPRDLETICLKCLRKEPDKRYRSAQALADDLKRFLKGEPIQARPVGRVERSIKWVKRHPAVASLLTVVAIVTLAGIVGITLAYGYALTGWDKASKEWQRAETKAEEAKVNELDALDKKKLAEAQKQVALEQGRKALEQRWRSQGLLYDSMIKQTFLEHQSGDNHFVLDRLARCRWDLRRWEHAYLWTSGLRTVRTFALPEAINGVAVSPDGAKIAVALGQIFSPGGEVKVLDLESGKELFALKGHATLAKCVAFSKDGSKIVSAGGQVRKFGQIKVWNAADGKELLTFKGHKDLINCVAFSPDGSRIVSGAYLGDASVKIWNAADGKEIRTLTGFAGCSVESVAVNNDGTRIVAGGGTNLKSVIKVWDAADGKELLSPTGHAGFVTCVAFSPDGKRIVSSNGYAFDAKTGKARADKNGEIKLWDAASGKELLHVPGNNESVASVAFSPEGTRMVSGGLDKAVRIRDVFTGVELLALKGHKISVGTVAFCPDGNRIVSSAGDKTVKVWDAAGGKEPITLATGYVAGMGFTPDGRRLLLAGNDPVLSIWDLVNGKKLETRRGTKNSTAAAAIAAAAFSPDGSRMATAAVGQFKMPGPVVVRDTADGKNPQAFRGHSDKVICLAFSPDGKKIASGSMDATIKVWDLQSGKEAVTLKGHKVNVLGLAFSPDGARIASCSGDGAIKIWDALSDGAGGKELLNIDTQKKPIWRIAFSPDGARLAGVGGLYGQPADVIVWNTVDGKRLLSLAGHSDQVLSVTFSPDGARIVTGSRDGTVKLWDAAAADREPFTLTGHRGGVRFVAFSPDGSRLVSVGDPDGTMKIWDASGWQDQRLLPGLDKDVRSAAFAAEGQLAITADTDGNVALWDVNRLSIRQTVKALAGSGSALALSPNGDAVAVAGGKSVKLWQPGVDKLGPNLQEAAAVITALAFSPDGAHVVGGMKDGTLGFWDRTASHTLRSFKGHPGEVLSVAADIEGRFLLSGGTDKIVRLWDSATGKPLQAFHGHSAGITAVAFSVDGHKVISGDANGVIKVWDAASSKELSTLTGHTGRILSVAFGFDGTRAVSVDAGRTLRYWSIPHPARSLE